MRSVESRCIIQNKDGSDKYYPKVVSVNISSTFPWTAPVNSIVINTNVSTGTAGYMSPVGLDDIVRLQVNTRNSPDEKSVWQDIFEGRIMAISVSFSDNNLTTLQCRGHGEELLYRAVTANYSATATTGTILAALMTYLTRLTDTTLIDTAASTSITYNVDLDTKYMVDVVRELESLEGYGYILDIITSYTNGDLATNVVSWQPVPSLSNKVQIIEGTPRLISATFSKSISNLVEDVTIYGNAVSGTSIDGAPAYGTRFHVGVDSTIVSAALCASLAAAVRNRFGTPLTTGYVVILGDPNIAVGDLIYCKIPSIELDGSSIDGNYRVKRLHHNISSLGWFTMLDLGELIQSPHDVLDAQHAINRLTRANLI